MKYFFTIFTIIYCSVSFSQTTPQDSISKKNSFWKNVRFGGGINLAFGNTTTVGISPTAIYDFNHQFSLGLGAGYQYNKSNNYRSNVFNISIISLYNPFPNAQFSAEFEQNFVNRKINDITSNYDYPSLYIGAAYTIGNNFSIGLRYDVLYKKEKSIYTSAFSPIIRVYF